MKITLRTLYFLGFLACAAIIGYALYMQYVMYLDPCPLCIFQRLAVIATGLVLLLGAVINPINTRWMGLGIIATALVGLGLAIRHSWIQFFPPELSNECGPGLEMWLDRLPLWEVIGKVLHGTGECSDVVWRFLGLSIPNWTALLFLGFTLFGLWVLRQPGQTRY